MLYNCASQSHICQQSCCCQEPCRLYISSLYFLFDFTKKSQMTIFHEMTTSINKEGGTFNLISEFLLQLVLQTLSFLIHCTLSYILYG